MTFQDEGRKVLKVIIDHLVKNDLELSFSIIQGGYFYPGGIHLEDGEIERILDLLKEEPYASSLHRIRKGSKSSREKMIHLLVESLMREDIFEAFNSRTIGLDFQLDMQGESTGKFANVRSRGASSLLTTESHLLAESEKFIQIIVTGSSSQSADSQLNAEGEIV